jgi:hypothetical protein
VGGAKLEEWRHKMEERQEEQSKKLDSLDKLLQESITFQMNLRESRNLV